MKFNLLIFLCFISTLCKAQYGRLFTSDNDLSSSMINEIYQDSRGYIWISTSDGLNRYDGAKFVNYIRNDNDSTSLISNNVYSVFESSKGLTYVLSTNGLQVYNYNTDSFKTLAVSTLGYNNKCIIERKDSTVLVGTSGYGIKVIDHKEDGSTEIKTWNERLNGYTINNLFEDNNGNLWISTEYNGLVKVDNSGNETVYGLDDNNRLNYITICTQDDYGNIYVSSSGLGVFIYNEETDKFVPVYMTKYPITVITQRDDLMLFGTDGEGIKSYNIKTGEVLQAELFINDVDLSNAKVHSLISDSYKNLWIGIYQKGVAFLSSRYNKFNYIGYRSTLKNSIGDKCVTSICRGSKNEYLIGTDNDGVYILDENYNKMRHLSPHTPSSKVPGTVMCMYKDSNSKIWIGSFLGGLSYLDDGMNSFKYVSFRDRFNNKVDRVYSLTEDSDKRLWIGTMGAGLYYIDLSEPDMVKSSVYSNGSLVDLNDSINLWINTLYYSDKGNRLYIGTVDGIKCLDLSVLNYANVDLVLNGTTVTSITEGNDGSVWVGTIDGLMVFDKDLKNVLHSFTVSDGLPSNNISSITMDVSGNMWVSTNHGIAKFDSSIGMFIAYRASDGLYNNEFSKGAFYNDNNGMIYFGGTNGVVYFDPEEININQLEGNVRITSFYLHNQPVNTETKSGNYNVLSTDIMNEKEINLSHFDNSFAIEFATDNFSIPQSFAYSMNDGIWNTLPFGTSRVSFSNLPVGKYSFTVKSGSLSSESAFRTISIIIHPAWYASPLAKFIYGLLIISLVLFILYQVKLRYQAKQEMLKHKLQEEINEAKLQFFINISHEIRTPMSLIISPLHNLISTDNDPVRQKSYSLIERNADRILNLINQLMDTRKIDKQQMKLRFSETDLVSFVRDINDIFSYQADSKGVKLSVIPEVERLYAWIDPNNFDKVVLNILSNSFKHVPDHGEINIYIKSGTDNNIPYPLNNYAEIIIEDNGTGIKESEIDHIFERFYQIADDKSCSNGTGIGLHLSMSLVKLHHGTISAHNNMNKPGCSFVIRIPLGNAHLSKEEIFDDKSPYINKVNVEKKRLPVEDDNNETRRKMMRKKHTVLIVEDDVEIRKYLASELGCVYHILQCANGKDAYEIIISEYPDIVLSDIMMPEMDGMTLLRKIKQNIRINHIPVVLLTAKNSETENIEGLSFGADAYLTKPFNIDIVKITLENLLKNREVLKNNFSGGQEQESNMVYIKPESADDKLMKKVMNAINRNISNPELNVEMIASEVGISRVHLYRKLKELTNQSTRDFIRNTRLKQAEALLLSDKNYNISEIALIVGFSNSTYFSNAFKELYGMSPSKYVELHKNDRNDS